MLCHNSPMRTALLALIPVAALAQAAFEVATIKPADPDFRGRYITMQSTHQFLARNHSVRTLIKAAYNLHDNAVVGGPAWADTDRFDIQAVTPGEARPTQEQQMAMLRKLLADRFHLTFHREPKELSVYAIVAAKSGPKLAASTTPADKAPPLAIVVFPDHVEFPARNATILDFASVLQRAALDRPVVDRTGLTGRYDFDLAWTPDESQFGGFHAAEPVSGAPKPDLFAAIQQQIGLKLEATKAPIDIIVIDHVDHPTAN
jgi:uncharacterized protein (TIGR03435 family)